MSKLYTSNPGGRTKRTGVAKTKGQPADASALTKVKQGRHGRSVITGKHFTSTGLATTLHEFHMSGAAAHRGTDLHRGKKKSVDKADFAKSLLRAPASPSGFVQSPDSRIGYRIDRAEVRGSRFLAEAQARLDALPPGFSDDLRRASPWPADVPELLGRDES